MNVAANLHPTPNRLRDYTQGRLSPSEMDDIEQHLAICEPCALKLRQFGDDTLVELVRAAGQRTAADRPTLVPLPTAPSPPTASSTSPHDIPAELCDHPRYRVLQAIGMGGMGVVYKAEHRLMERLVALKVIHRQFMSHPTAVERFRQEVKAAGRLAHPNIVTAHDAEQAGDLHFLAMEYVEGVSLARLVEQKGPLPLSQACHFIRQAAIGLQHAHERGMVHRDIKPQNLMVTRKGQLKILDFGLARFASERDTNAANGLSVPAAGSLGTRQGSVLGTPDYMSPEQWQDPRTADARADIFSLGCTLFFVLAGRAPKLRRSKRSPAQPSEALGEALAAARPDVPPALVKLVAAMTSPDSADRPELRDVSRTLGLLAKEPAAVTPAEEGASSDAQFPEIQTESSSEKPTTSRRKLAPSQQLKLIAISCMGLVMLLVGVSILVAMFSNPVARREPSDKNKKAGEAKDGDVSQTMPIVAPKKQPKVLLVLPSQGLWRSDYVGTRQTLETLGAQLIVASTSMEPCRLHQQSPPGIAVDPDVVFSDKLDPEDYDAVVFYGYNTAEYQPEGVAGKATAKLIREMLRQRKPVAAICVGQEVLIAHGLLNNKQAALNEFIDKGMRERSDITWVNQPWVQQGDLLLGRTDSDTDPFARQLMKMIQSRSAHPRK